MGIGVNPPKSVVHEGSSGVSAATVPNICKMPGPPAPFVPTPLPNIGTSNTSPSGYTKRVAGEKKDCAIKGASFKSKGDMASKGTGGGLISAATHGKTKFVAPGSMDVKFEGKNVQLLGDAMTNNSSSPPNAATVGLMQGPVPPALSAGLSKLQEIADECDKPKVTSPTKSDGSKKSCTTLGTEKHACCEGKVQDHRDANPKNGSPPIEGETGYKRPELGPGNTVLMNQPPAVPTGPKPDLKAAFAQGKPAISKAFGSMKGNCYPDAAVLGGDGSKTFVDFKFPCPAGHPAGGGTSKGGAVTAMSKAQAASYDSLGRACGGWNTFVIRPT